MLSTLSFFMQKFKSHIRKKSPLCCNIDKGDDHMRERKYHIGINSYERGNIINDLNGVRNKPIAEGR